MNFKSQIATTREQSERLLALGLKPETADMAYDRYGNLYIQTEECLNVPFPAWSLGRLLEMMPGQIFESKNFCTSIQLCISGGVRYFGYARDYGYMPFCFKDGEPVTGCVSMIAWLIDNGHFNKEYLK